MEQKSWLRSVIAQMDAIPDSDLIAVGTEKVHKGEKVLGELTPDMRRLYMVWRKVCDEGTALLAKLEPEHARLLHERDEAGHRACHAQMEVVAHKAEAMRALFWEEVRISFGLETLPDIAIREGDKVVECVPAKDDGYGGPPIIIAIPMPLPAMRKID